MEMHMYVDKWVQYAYGVILCVREWVLVGACTLICLHVSGGAHACVCFLSTELLVSPVLEN
jgi:hypothetical protein